MKPTEDGLYIFDRTIVLVQMGQVWNVLGTNDFMGSLERLPNEGWGEKLDEKLDYDPDYDP